jgi:hypothetical protein
MKRKFLYHRSNKILFFYVLFIHTQSLIAPVIYSYFKEQVTWQMFQSSTFSLRSNFERFNMAEEADDYFFMVSV